MVPGLRRRCLLPVLLMGSLGWGVSPLRASTTVAFTTTSRNAQARVVSRAHPEDDANLILESLRTDVARHPNDYVIFETQIAAHCFLAGHIDAQQETGRAMVQRGILGYWRGKTIAVVPSLALADHAFAAR